MPALVSRVGGGGGGGDSASGSDASISDRAPVIRPDGHRFQAELEVSEIDERNRPGPAWAAKSIELSKSHLVFLSRRMCYPGRVLAVAVHLIDDRPVPLLGRVVSCGYCDDGAYKVDLDLSRIPDGHSIYEWAVSRNGMHRKRA